MNDFTTPSTLDIPALIEKINIHWQGYKETGFIGVYDHVLLKELVQAAEALTTLSTDLATARTNVIGSDNRANALKKELLEKIGDVDLLEADLATAQGDAKQRTNHCTEKDEQNRKLHVELEAAKKARRECEDAELFMADKLTALQEAHEATRQMLEYAKDYARPGHALHDTVTEALRLLSPPASTDTTT